MTNMAAFWFSFAKIYSQSNVFSLIEFNFYPENKESQIVKITPSWLSGVDTRIELSRSRSFFKKVKNKSISFDIWQTSWTDKSMANYPVIVFWASECDEIGEVCSIWTNCDQSCALYKLFQLCVVVCCSALSSKENRRKHSIRKVLMRKSTYCIMAFVICQFLILIAWIQSSNATEFV